MKILSYNIRGLGGAGKKRHIRDLVMKERVDFLVIQETKMGVISRKICSSLWGSEEFNWVAKDSMGMSGGLLCIWNSKMLNKIKVIKGENFIGIEGVWGSEEIPVKIINVYSPCQLASKRALWEELRNLAKGKGGKWCFVGDFNAVRKADAEA